MDSARERTEIRGWAPFALLAFLFLDRLTAPLDRAPAFRALALLLGLSLAAWAVAPRSVARWVGLGLALALGTLVLVPAREVQAGVLVATSLFLGYVSVTLLLAVLRQREVSAATISSALSVYLLMAWLWTSLYALVEELAPGSFGGLPTAADPGLARELRLDALGYFSFVTLTTLGYGDVVPRGEWARTLATLEAVVGQLYLVVLVARLVSLHAARESAPPR